MWNNYDDLFRVMAFKINYAFCFHAHICNTSCLAYCDDLVRYTFILIFAYTCIVHVHTHAYKCMVKECLRWPLHATLKEVCVNKCTVKDIGVKNSQHIFQSKQVPSY